MMQVINKNIFDYKCPCCDIILSGSFTVQYQKYIAQFDRTIIFDLYYFNCPNKNRKIVMCETNYLPNTIFWLAEYEKFNSNNLYVKYPKINSFNLINIFYPLEDTISNILYEHIKNIKFPLIIGKKSLLTNIKDSEMNKFICAYYMIEDVFFKTSEISIYPSLLVEKIILNFYNYLNINNYYSIYPTILDNSITLCKNIDFLTIKKLFFIK